MSSDVEQEFISSCGVLRHMSNESSKMIIMCPCFSFGFCWLIAETESKSGPPDTEIL